MIEYHLVYQILIPIASGLIEEAIQGRITLGHNMTGNTINSYAVGVYLKGTLAYIESAAGKIPNPLRRKLGNGQRFYAGNQRWDGEVQERTFTAKSGSNGTMEPEQSIAFLMSYRASPNGYTIVVCNGVEYATYQENEMNIDVLTNNVNFATMFAPSMFKPISA